MSKQQLTEGHTIPVHYGNKIFYILDLMSGDQILSFIRQYRIYEHIEISKDEIDISNIYSAIREYLNKDSGKDFYHWLDEYCYSEGIFDYYVLAYHNGDKYIYYTDNSKKPFTDNLNDNNIRAYKDKNDAERELKYFSSPDDLFRRMNNYQIATDIKIKPAKNNLFVVTGKDINTGDTYYFWDDDTYFDWSKSLTDKYLMSKEEADKRLIDAKEDPILSFDELFKPVNVRDIISDTPLEESKQSIEKAWAYEVYRASDSELLATDGGLKSYEVAVKYAEETAQAYEEQGYGECSYDVFEDTNSTPVWNRKKTMYESKQLTEGHDIQKYEGFELDLDTDLTDRNQELEEDMENKKLVEAAGQRGRYEVEVFDEGDWHKLNSWSTIDKAVEAGEAAVEAVYQDYRVIDKESGEPVELTESVLMETGNDLTEEQKKYVEDMFAKDKKFYGFPRYDMEDDFVEDVTIDFEEEEAINMYLYYKQLWEQERQDIEEHVAIDTYNQLDKDEIDPVVEVKPVNESVLMETNKVIVDYTPNGYHNSWKLTDRYFVHDDGGKYHVCDGDNGNNYLFNSFDINEVNNFIKNELHLDMEIAPSPLVNKNTEESQEVIDDQYLIDWVGACFETGHGWAEDFDEFEEMIRDEFGSEISSDKLKQLYSQYQEMCELGPAGFYEEYRDRFDFSSDYISEYGDEEYTNNEYYRVYVKFDEDVLSAEEFEGEVPEEFSKCEFEDEQSAISAADKFKGYINQHLDDELFKGFENVHVVKVWMREDDEFETEVIYETNNDMDENLVFETELKEASLSTEPLSVRLKRRLNIKTEDLEAESKEDNPYDDDFEYSDYSNEYCDDDMTCLNDYDDEEEAQIDMLFHDADEEELRRMGAFDNLNDEEEDFWLDEDVESEDLKWNIGSNKLVSVDSEEYSRLVELAKMLTEKSANGYKYEVEQTYEDFGADMQWQNIVCYDRTGSKWQVLNTKEWLDLANAQKSIEQVYDEVVNDEYFEDTLEKGDVRKMNHRQLMSYMDSLDD